MYKWFSENMSQLEAQHRLFALIKSKPVDEHVSIKQEYSDILPVLLKRDADAFAEDGIIN